MVNRDKKQIKKVDDGVKDGDRVPLKEAILYGSAEIYGGGSATLISIVLLFYLNWILGINPIIAGGIIFVSKAWDAVSDPLMGVISDNTRSKYGRRKPYMVIGGVLTFIAMIWLFAPIKDLSYAGKITVAVLGYIFFCTANTVSQVPFCSLSSDISPSEKERNKANTVKLIFSMIGAAVCFLVPSLIIDQQKKILETNPAQAQMSIFLYIGVIFAFVFAIPLIVSGLATKERTPYDKNEKAKFSFKSYLVPFKVKSYKWHLLMYIGAFLCMDIISALFPYYVVMLIEKDTVLFGSVKLGALTLVAPMMITAGAMIPLVLWMSKKKTKQFAFRIGLPLYVIGGILLSCYQPTWSPWAVPICAIIMGVGMGGAQSMPWIIFPDTVDIAELKYGVRDTGTYSGLMTFSRKMTQAIAIFLLGMVLGAFGAEKNDKGEIISVEVAKMPIRILMMATVIFFISIAFYASIKHKVDSKKLIRVRYYLDKAREGADKDVLTEEELVEKASLLKELA